MIGEIAGFAFFFVTFLTIAYLVRHVVFTLAVLRTPKDRKDGIVEISYQPSVSILIPAHNEERVIDRILHRMTELSYPKDKLQIVVINDASTDATGQIAENRAQKCGYLKVLQRYNKGTHRGKAAALNDALRLCEGEIVLCFDADYYPQRDIVEKLVSVFVDPAVGAVQGRVIVLNEPQNVVTRLVALERIGGYRVDQQARESLGLIPQFGGTVGGIRKSLLDQLGGWDEKSLAEDTDLTFRTCLAGYTVRYVNDAECYEEAVESWSAYRKQRYRWARGHMQCAFKYSLKVLTSRRLNFRRKLDGLLLLGVYFMPVLALLSFVSCAVLLTVQSSPWWFGMVWAMVPISLYSFVGNFAPFFEVGIGAYLDGRTRAQWLISLLIFTFLYNIIICTKAFVDLLISKILGRNGSFWIKTAHSGNGNDYILK